MKKYSIHVTIALSLLVFGCSKSNNNTVTPTPTSTSGVTTYVGNGTAGLLNGSGTGIEFNAPVGVTITSTGFVFVSEQGNNDIRVISPGSIVSTFAGAGTPGYKDGSNTTAEFNNPQGMVADNEGNIYVADAGNNVIRKITPDGVVSTYAGDGKAGLLNGSATSAEFSSPRGLAIDKSRNIYVADYGNNVIREISSSGTVSTYAGNGTAGLVNGTAATAEFQNPSSVVIDGSFNVYVADAGNNAIREIVQGGKVNTYATGLPTPVWIALDGSGNMYASCANSTIQYINSAGKVSTYAGTGNPGFSNGPLLSSEFNNPLGLIANDQGVLVVADNANNRLRLVTP